MDADFLYVSIGWTEGVIPLNHVESAETFAKAVVIRFSVSTKFGDQISFHPRGMHSNLAC